MESVHGVDVSWMSKQNSNNGKDNRPQPMRGNSASEKDSKATHNVEQPSAPKSIPNSRPGFSRSGSTDKTVTVNGSMSKSGSPSPSNSRRNSWLSSISSKFSSSASPNAASSNTIPSTPPIPTTTSLSTEPSVPTGPSHPKNAILPHGTKPATGDSPYTPAPVRAAQPSFLQSALRRLSSSGGQLATGNKAGQHGLCPRQVLNVDRNRERCHISELNQSKLRRVAFCVDVEIASGPRYHDEEASEERKKKRDERKKVVEDNEGQALKTPEVVIEEKENNALPAVTGKRLPDVPEKQSLESTIEQKDDTVEKDGSKKKEKKKRSEEERKARKEKKRKLAEANGTLPVELVRNGSDSSLNSSPAGGGTPRTQASPTTDPVRIYRRCCQLRETPILKKITEQLAEQAARSVTPGMVGKLDLSGYWLQPPDLVTLGDYLAVVPVKELIMENCGLTDEGVRVILAGLLAAKCPEWENLRFKKGRSGEAPQGGFVERLILKNNNKIGKNGWTYICTFIAMCRTLKSLDVSKCPFPQATASTPPINASGQLSRTTTASSTTSSVETKCSQISGILCKAIGERLGGKEFELLNMAECGLSTDQLGHLVDGIVKSGLRRLGIAGNSITPEGIQHVARYIREGKCEGLDLGGNYLKDQLGVIAEALSDENHLYALSLADCHLSAESLSSLFPALAKLNNFRFIDLSQNHDLFDAQPSALSLLRRYLPKMPTLKRIHLTDVSMSPEQAIALAEILPESPNLAHVNMMENPLLAALANAKDEANQEEACALYASLMAAVRVSKTIICIDIEVPSSGSSEIVKALAKQVVAYCLFNMERGPVAEISEANTVSEFIGDRPGEKQVVVPDVLLHLVGHLEDLQDSADDEPAPDEDYVLGGTGVVKALGICLRNSGNGSRRPSLDRALSGMSEAGSGSVTPKAPVHGGKAKDMSKNLLQSARRIRARLQPSLIKESKAIDKTNYQRLQFLDQTLEGMIKRFEDEYPETRLPVTIGSLPSRDIAQVSPVGSLDLGAHNDGHVTDTEPAFVDEQLTDNEEIVRPMLSRHNSDVSLASRALSQEEGRMHRFGQQFRRDILKPEGEDHAHGTTGHEETPAHLQMLRAMVEGLGGDEIKEKIMTQGTDAVLEELSNDASALRQQLKEQDSEGWLKFVEAHEAALRNQRLAGLERNVSAIE